MPADEWLVKHPARKDVTWWNENNFGSGDAAFVNQNRKQRIEIDRDGLFGDGIIAGLRGDRDGSALKIMENELDLSRFGSAS